MPLNTPFYSKNLFPDIVCSGNPENPFIYLTINGSGEKAETLESFNELFDILNIKATFFISENFVDHSKQTVEKIHLAGHVLGSLVDSQSEGSSLSREQIEKRVLEIEKKILAITKVAPVYLRSVEGKVSIPLLEALKYNGIELILWDVSPSDIAIKHLDNFISHLASHIKNGSIIMLSDSYQHLKITTFLQPLLMHLIEKKFQFKTIDDLFLNARTGINPSP